MNNLDRPTLEDVISRRDTIRITLPIQYIGQSEFTRYKIFPGNKPNIRLLIKVVGFFFPFYSRGHGAVWRKGAAVFETI